MKILIDSSNLKEIENIYKIYPVDGVTTNPSILLKENIHPYKQLCNIYKFLQNKDQSQLHIQTTKSKTKDIIEETLKFNEVFSKDIFVKIPANKEGLAAIKYLSTKNLNITATAIYSTQQAVLAAKAGANYVAPYVNRMENLYHNGIKTVKDIQKIFDNYNLDTKILGASFKSIRQINKMWKIGVEAVTLQPQVMYDLLSNTDVDMAIDKFNEDFSLLLKNTSNHNKGDDDKWLID